MNRWIIKSDPDDYSAHDLERDGQTVWDGVSNAAALGHLRRMTAGDVVLVYHTGEERALVALAGVKATSMAADGKTPRVTLAFKKWLPAPVQLAAIKADSRQAELGLVRIGRLSVMPATAAQWAGLLALSKTARHDLAR
ncbi:MAG: EVE domain-containing protein [Phycisphaerae bacterium]